MINITGNFHLIPSGWESRVVDHPFEGSLEQLAIVSRRVLRVTRMSGLFGRADGCSPLPTTYRQNVPTTVFPPLGTIVKRPYNGIRSSGER